mmetsp:Transcript_41780/g.77635  ORF Transcript_41780/g.77635 Transcript_41780/m.77635 type:complete len:233 (-) Transcript_41780:42-740(-)
MRWRYAAVLQRTVLQAPRYCRGNAGHPASKFDVFQKLKDPPEEDDQPKKKRKPSDKVLRLVDEIVSLTLVEAADLCDLCQEKLQPADGLPRLPFPHPVGMFQGVVPGAMPMGAMPAGMPAGMPPAGMPPAMPGAPAQAPAAAEGGEAEAAEAPKAKKEEKKKETYTLKLVSFDSAKKINVVKEVRAITGAGLKESKELVESVPKVLKKGVPAAEAEALKEKLAAVGGEVSLE